MSNTPHELHEEFPQDLDRIHALKIHDQAFAALLEGYNEVNRTVHRMETDIETVADQDGDGPQPLMQGGPVAVLGDAFLGKSEP